MILLKTGFCLKITVFPSLFCGFFHVYLKLIPRTIILNKDIEYLKPKMSKPILFNLMDYFEINWNKAK